MEAAKKLRHFLSCWYLRYELATELYMVEPWEKMVIHILFAVLFALFWYFNYSIVISSVSQLRSTASNIQPVS